MDLIAKFDDRKKQRRRRRRLRTISTFPTLLTLGNLLCGFAAIHFCLRALLNIGAGIPDNSAQTLSSVLMERALPSYLCISAFLIFGGLFFDMLDGRVARMTQKTSTFGGQLDSLADMITFGAAPALLVITIITKYLHAEWMVAPLSDNVIGRGVWMTAAVFVSCAALRLARFNVEHAGAELSHTNFHGLPSPGAGAMLASLVLLQEHSSGLGGTAIIRALPLVTLAAGLLMVSRFRYVHLSNAYLKGRRPFWQVVLLSFLAMVFLWRPAPALAVIVCGYVASGPIAALVRLIRVRTRSVPPQQSFQAPQEQESDPAQKHA